MTSLAAVAAYLPPTSVPIESLADHLGLADQQIRMFQRFYGLSHIRLDDGTVADLLVRAAGQLDALPGHLRRIRYVLHARTIQVTGPYPMNLLHEVRTRLGLEHATAFSLTEHACASGLLAVDLAGRLLAADGDPDAVALVFAGEKVFTPSVQLIPNTSILGEAAVAFLVSNDDEHNRVLSYVSRTHGQFHTAPTLSPELAADFEESYLDRLQEVVLSAVEQAGMRLDEVDLILPHNVNRLSWVRLCKKMGFPIAKVLLTNVPITGHCFCADAFINHTTAVQQGLLKPGDRYLMAAVGIEATFSAMVFQY